MDIDYESKIDGRKARVSLGYGISTLGYLTAAVVALSKYGVTPFSSYTVAGPVLAAACSHVQLGAAKYNRLGSATYKRLNLMSAQYGVLGLLISALAPQTQKPYWWAWTILSFITTVNSIKGFAYGVQGWELKGEKLDGFSKELRRGFSSTLLIMDPEVSLLQFPPNVKTLSYYLATLFSGGLKVVKMWTLASLLVNGASASEFVNRLSRYAKLSLMTMISLTLKDAAARNRFSGTTFIELNFALSLAFGSLATYLHSIPAPAILTLSSAYFSAIMTFYGLFGLITKARKR